MTRALLACRSFFLCFDWIVAVRTPHQGEGDTNGCVVCRNIPGWQARMLRLRRRKEELSLPLYFIYAEMKCCCCSLGVRSGRGGRERCRQVLFYTISFHREDFFYAAAAVVGEKERSSGKKSVFLVQRKCSIGERCIAVGRKTTGEENLLPGTTYIFEGMKWNFKFSAQTIIFRLRRW